MLPKYVISVVQQITTPATVKLMNTQFSSIKNLNMVLQDNPVKRNVLKKRNVFITTNVVQLVFPVDDTVVHRATTVKVLILVLEMPVMAVRISRKTTNHWQQKTTVPNGTKQTNV